MLITPWTTTLLPANDKAIEILEATNKMDGSIFLNCEFDLWSTSIPSIPLWAGRLGGNPQIGEQEITES